MENFNVLDCHLRGTTSCIKQIVEGFCERCPLITYMNPMPINITSKSEINMENKLIVGEDGICPVTKKHCDDECCPIGAECNISGNDISDIDKKEMEKCYNECCVDSYEQELLEIQELSPNVKNFFYNPHWGQWILHLKDGIEEMEFDTKKDMMEFINFS